MPTVTTIANFVRAARVERVHRATERADRAVIERDQRAALTAIVAHARAASPYYRRLYSEHGVDEWTPLTGLPPVDKADLVAHFDEWVTDRRVTFAGARANVDAGTGENLANEFAVMASGGSSRTPGVYVFNRAEWTIVTAMSLRLMRWAGVAPRIPRQRVAFAMANGPQHMASRVGASLDVGAHRTLRLDASARRERMVDALNTFRPTVLSGYASVIAALASEQQAGTLSIAPTRVMTSSEPRSADMTAKIRAAWGVEPHDIYATTENGPIASDCRAHRGLHVMEDRAIVEVVDADDKPVPDGEPGHHMLVTNLFNRTQPFIRHRLSDMAAYELGSCSCGLPFRRLRSVDGRVDDIIELTTADGRTASIHPTAFSPLFALDGVGELDVVQRGDHLVVHVVASSTARNGDGTDTVRRRLGEILAEHQCERASVTVTPVERLERNQRSGKIKLVRREK